MGRIFAAVFGVVCAVAGVVAVAYGLWLIYEPLAWVVSGAAAVVVGLSVDVGRS